MISIIIPAYNEENVITRCLAPLLPAARDKELEIIVVCNGCTDTTAQIVASFQEVKLIETPIPSKSKALNLGDQAACGFPRFYLDADIVLPLDSVRKVAEVLRSGKFLAAAPQMQVDYSHSSWFVKAYYDVWQQLPYIQEGMIGTGVYALSEEGRRRFDTFPDIVADDEYIRILFDIKEKKIAVCSFSIVVPPKKIKYLLKISKRNRIGMYEIAKKYPYLVDNKKRYIVSFVKIIKKDLIFKIPVYFYVSLLSRIMAICHIKKNSFTGWERDPSSR